MTSPAPLHSRPSHHTYLPLNARETFRIRPEPVRKLNPGSSHLPLLKLLKLVTQLNLLPFVACYHRDRQNELGALISSTKRIDVIESGPGNHRQLHTLSGDLLLDGTELYLSRILQLGHIDPYPYTDGDLAYLTCAMSRERMTVYFQGTAYPLRVRYDPQLPGTEDHLIMTKAGEYRFASRTRSAHGQPEWSVNLSLLETSFIHQSLPTPSP